MSNHRACTYHIYYFFFYNNITYILNRETAVVKNIIRLVHIDLLITHSFFNQ